MLEFDTTRQGVPDRDPMTAAWLSGILFLTLTVWISAKGETAKYVLYTLPFTMTLAYAVVNRWELKLHMPALWGFLLYMALAVGGMIANSWYDFNAYRDVAIVGGYLLLFVPWFRAPSWSADLALGAIAVGLVVEAATEGIADKIDLFGSDGILESTLAFPLGAVVIYYAHSGRWGRVLLASVLLFLSFKRIAFLGVAVAIGFDMVLARYLRLGAARIIALASVAVLSLLALFSTQIFEYVTTALSYEQTSADSISLGRYAIAVRLWSELEIVSWMSWLIGSGPGSADALVAANFQLVNPHNDWLKILYDYGVLGFIALHAIIYWTYREHRLALMLYLYTAIVMMTDNIFIYMFYHPFMMMMMSAARR